MRSCPDTDIDPQKTRHRTMQERIEVTIRRRKWRWIGHTLRKPATNITRLSLEWNPQGVRRKSRPKKSWRRTIQQEYEDLGMSWVRWKAVVETLCSGRSKEKLNYTFQLSTVSLRYIASTKQRPPNTYKKSYFTPK